MTVTTSDPPLGLTKLLFKENDMKTKEEYIDDVKQAMIEEELKEAGFDFATAIATKAEIAAGAACGQLAIINED